MAAGSKRVRLYIDSDATGVQKGVGQAQRSLRGFEGQAKKTQSVMGGLRTTAGGLGLAFGAAGLAIGINESLTAFKDQEKQMARVIATLKTLGVNTDAMRKKVLAVTDAQSKLSGFQDDELQASFSTILRVSRDTEESFKLNALAMDIARGSGKNLQVVALAIAKAVDGNANALVRYGVKAQKGATVTEVLTLAQKRYAGQAKEFGDSAAGGAARADVAIDQLKQSIGGKLAPAMETAASATIKLSGATGSFIDHAGGIGPVVAGASGFGAFKLLAPTIGNAGSALGALGRVAGNQGAGASFRVLGSAVGASINPMTAAAVGAGLLAGGIYQLWQSSDSAEKAISHLNSTINNLNSALDQKTAAQDAVNSARDIAKTTGDAALAARNHTAALRTQRAELERHNAGSAVLESISKKITKAEQAETEAIHANERSHHNLTAAKRNLATAGDGVTASSDEQAAAVNRVNTQVEMMTRDQRVAGRSGVIFKDALASSATNAAVLAGKLDSASAATRRTDSALSKTDANLAAFIRNVQRLPTKREVRIVTEMTRANKDLDAILLKLGRVQSKSVTVRFNQTFGARVDPLTGLPKKAGGGMIPGRYSDGDRVPAMLSGGEAVLNPLQIGMVDSGMSVMGALSATGAPTTGAGFAKGKAPASRGGAARESTHGGMAVRVADPMIAKVAKALTNRQGAWDFAQASSQLRIAQADGNAGANVEAYVNELNVDNARRKAIMAILANPAKALGVKGAKLTRSQRTDLTQALASTLGEMSDDRQTIQDLLHPAAPEGADTSEGEAGSIDAGPTPDQQAELDQRQRKIDVLTRSGALSEAALRGFGSSGDIGSGNFGSAFDAARGGPQIAMLGDARSLQAFAAGATAGMGLQPSISANASSVRI